jgi:putative transposase
MSLQGALAIERMCLLVGVSRSGFYRFLRDRDHCDEDMAVRSEVQKIVLEHCRRYGYRRITAELRRRGMLVNHKRVARIMREDNLVGTDVEWTETRTRRTRFDDIHINLANRMNVKGANQLWVADITFVRLKRDFVYVAVVIDRFSRKVVGWSVATTLTARLPIAALEKAIESREPPPGLVHHSDQGVQYLQAGYLRTLRRHGIIASVSRPGMPGDNANCESFFRTLKHEEIHARAYQNLEDLRLNVSAFIECYYNERRLHSALGYRSPAEFERVAVSHDAATISSPSEVGVARTVLT